MSFSDFDLSILGEIGNVSVGGAATSLSDFVNKMVTISIPETKVITFKELKESFGPSAVTAKIDYTSGFNGSNMLLMKKEEALEFAKIIVREKLSVEIDEWNEFAENVIKESYNIMVGNMSTSMSAVFNKNVKIAPPNIFEQKSNDLSDYSDGTYLITIWFDVIIEDELKIRLVNIVEMEQGEKMIKIIKGDHKL